MADNFNLGKLEKLDLREIWRSEAQDFTPWLAREDNLALLGEALGMDLELELQEKNVGPFRADLLCKDTLDGAWVLIENQLERTDHTHLGQLLTYASGLHAVTIVWLAARFTDEHRAALDWLNEITEDKFRFFGLEVELWRIGESPAAPKFNVVSKPNEWSRSVGEAARRIENEVLSDTKSWQLQFWQAFHAEMAANKGNVRPQKPYPQHWMNFSVGRSGFKLSAFVNERESQIEVELYIDHDEAKKFFGMLFADREQIEGQLGHALEWMELPHRSACRIVYSLNGVDPSDRNRSPEYRRWISSNLESFYRVFRQRIRELELDSFSAKPPGEEP